jgi:hypothetical protein
MSRPPWRLLLRFFMGWSFVVFVVMDIYVWLARPVDPPLVGFYAAMAQWSGFWDLFHTFLLLCLLGAGGEAVAVTVQLFRR